MAGTGTGQKILDAIPLPDRIIKWGSIAGALVAIAGAWTYFGGPTPMMRPAPEIKALEATMEVMEEYAEELKEEIEDVQEVRDEDRHDFLSKAIREDKRELYTIINQMEQQGPSTELMEQQILLEEEIQENETEREIIRTKKKGD